MTLAQRGQSKQEASLSTPAPEGMLSYCTCTRSSRHKSAERNLASQWPKRPQVRFCHKNEMRRCQWTGHQHAAQRWIAGERHGPPLDLFVTPPPRPRTHTHVRTPGSTNPGLLIRPLWHTPLHQLPSNAAEGCDSAQGNKHASLTPSSRRRQRTSLWPGFWVVFRTFGLTAGAGRLLAPHT